RRRYSGLAKNRNLGHRRVKTYPFSCQGNSLLLIERNLELASGERSYWRERIHSSAKIPRLDADKNREVKNELDHNGAAPKERTRRSRRSSRSLARRTPAGWERRREVRV